MNITTKSRDITIHLTFGMFKELDVIPLKELAVLVDYSEPTANALYIYQFDNCFEIVYNVLKSNPKYTLKFKEPRYISFVTAYIEVFCYSEELFTDVYEYLEIPLVIGDNCLAYYTNKLEELLEGISLIHNTIDVLNYSGTDNSSGSGSESDSD